MRVCCFLIRNFPTPNSPYLPSDPVWRNLIVHAFQGQSSHTFGNANLEKGDKVVGVSIFADTTNSAVRIWHEHGGSIAVEKLSHTLRPHFPSIGVEKEQYTGRRQKTNNHPHAFVSIFTPFQH